MGNRKTVYKDYMQWYAAAGTVDLMLHPRVHIITACINGVITGVYNLLSLDGWHRKVARPGSIP